MKIFNNRIRCPRCGEEVKLPLAWILGLEMVFYCSKCRKSFLLNYRFGAIAWGIGLIAATLIIQILGLIGCGFATVLSVILFIPTMTALTLFIRTKLLFIKYKSESPLSAQDTEHQIPPDSE